MPAHSAFCSLLTRQLACPASPERKIHSVRTALAACVHQAAQRAQVASSYTSPHYMYTCTACHGMGVKSAAVCRVRRRHRPLSMTRDVYRLLCVSVTRRRPLEVERLVCVCQSRQCVQSEFRVSDTVTAATSKDGNRNPIRIPDRRTGMRPREPDRTLEPRGRDDRGARAGRLHARCMCPVGAYWLL